MHEFLLYDQFTYVVTGAAIFLGLLGLVLTSFGFPLWYLRVQKPLDSILAKQATKDRCECLTTRFSRLATLATELHFVRRGTRGSLGSLKANTAGLLRGPRHARPGKRAALSP